MITNQIRAACGQWLSTLIMLADQHNYYDSLVHIIILDALWHTHNIPSISIIIDRILAAAKWYVITVRRALKSLCIPRV